MSDISSPSDRSGVVVVVPVVVVVVVVEDVVGWRKRLL